MQLSTLARPRWLHLTVALALAAALATPAAGIAGGAPSAAAAEDVTSVTLAGSLQSELGCSEDWQPACPDTHLQERDGGIWSAVFTVPAGDYEYKIAINDSWEESYGAGGAPEGANIPLALPYDATLRFRYDATTHVVTVSPASRAPGLRSQDQRLARNSFRKPLTRERFYFVMPDRFANGSTANDQGGITGGRLESGFDPTDKGFYHGGDLAGLIKKLDYIKGLGTTALWMTPIFKNKPVQGSGADASAGYHGYWITDFTQVDPHFGTNAELRTLIDKAHARGIKVFFDIITNHTADVINYRPKAGHTPYGYVPKADYPYRDASGDVFDDRDYADTDTFPPLDPEVSFPYVPYFPTPADAEAKSPAWLNDLTVYHNRGDSTFEGESSEYGDFFGLDDLFTERPKVLHGMQRIFKSWVDLGIDGYRIDTVKHVNLEFWQRFVPSIQKYADKNGRPKFFMFGEVVDGRPSFDSIYTTAGKLPATLDFPFQGAAVGFTDDRPTTGLRDTLAADDYYTDRDSNVYALPTFLGNHDSGRIGYFLRNDHPDASAAELLKRDRLAHSLLYLVRGQPIVYYGDEQGFTGDGGDKDARQDMFPTKVDSYADDELIGDGQLGHKSHYGKTGPMYRWIANLARLAKFFPALRDGAQIHRYASNDPGVYAFSRINRVYQREFVVGVNNAAEAKTVPIDTYSAHMRFDALLPDGATGFTTDREGRTELTVPPLSTVVYKAAHRLGDSKAAPAMRFTAPERGATVGPRPEVRVTVRGDGFNQVTFAAKPVGGRSYRVLGTDDNVPYRVFPDLSRYAVGTPLRIRTVLKDRSGNLSVANTYLTVGDESAADTGGDGGGGGEVTQPDSVTVAGSMQSEAGCPGDWQPDCAKTHLTRDQNDDIWKGGFDLPKGDYEYKAAIDDSWSENYGLHGDKDGANIPLPLGADKAVHFYYDHATHWVADDVTSAIATAPGSFQSEMGCADDWDPACMRSWLQDPDGDGTYSFTTTAIPAGSYETKVAHDLSWDENYGEGGEPDGANIAFAVPSDGSAVTFSYVLETHVLTVTSGKAGPSPDLTKLKAQWVDRSTLAWQLGDHPADRTYRLHWSRDAGLSVDAEALLGGSSIPLRYSRKGLTDTQLERFPQLAGYDALKIPPYYRHKVRGILRAQVAVAAYEDTGQVWDATSVQIAGVLDDIYAGAARERLGVRYAGGVPTLRLWAPTAQRLSVRTYRGPNTDTYVSHRMSRDGNGVWSLRGRPSWTGRYYTFAERVYAPTTQQIEKNVVTDPYSLGLSVNSRRSLIVDLSASSTKPRQWAAARKPSPSAAAVRQTVYELHVRDFSWTDESVPERLRGTYRAFTVADSAGMSHLRTLAKAGPLTVHLLPAFDFATVEERRAAQERPPCDLASYPPDSEEQQKCVGQVADTDGYNWGYDPYHYTAPEGSYATHPNGVSRIREFRAMVRALHAAGTRVVMDVVYNHTSSSGQDPKSVLDKVVPGYYHRLDASGNVYTSTCCPDTATEHRMMGKLVVDSVRTWAKQYKIDGFRFDLMGHQPKANILDVRRALDRLTVGRDGVDGRRVYLYGEGWNFGEVADDALFTQATQANMAGTGVGTFNDRLRDAVRGGGPFDDNPHIQGFGSGLWSDPNGDPVNGTAAEQRDRLELSMDQIKVGLAGNLADYTFLDRTGAMVKGSDVLYNGSPTGYTARPTESITYVDAHDGTSLYDALAYKLPQSTPMADRVRMQVLSLSAVALGQGVPFLQAATDVLRSKSLDNNSYNSGDWFNRIDWTLHDNGWGSGLPPEGDNGAKWSYARPLLADPDLEPGTAAITAAGDRFRDLMAIRESSRLFRLAYATPVQKKVSFPVSSSSCPGVIVMRIDDTVGDDMDPRYRGAVVVWNATPESATTQVPGAGGGSYALHPVQAGGSDPVVKAATYDAGAGSFTVPGRTVAVFMQ